MGSVTHTGMFVTSFDSERASAIYAMAKDLFPKTISALMESPVNGYSSFAVMPCGSKVGWPEAEEHDKNLEVLVNYIRMYDYEDGSSPIEFKKVEYGAEISYNEKQHEAEKAKQELEILVKKLQAEMDYHQQREMMLEKHNRHLKRALNEKDADF